MSTPTRLDIWPSRTLVISVDPRLDMALSQINPKRSTRVSSGACFCEFDTFDKANQAHQFLTAMGLVCKPVYYKLFLKIKHESARHTSLTNAACAELLSLLKVEVERSLGGIKTLDLKMYSKNDKNLGIGVVVVDMFEHMKELAKKSMTFKINGEHIDIVLYRYRPKPQAPRLGETIGF